MRSSTEPTDTLGTFPSKPTEQAAKPSPAPVVRQISKHVREVNGRMETDSYPKSEPKPDQIRMSLRLLHHRLPPLTLVPNQIYGKRFSGVIVDELDALPAQTQGLPCRYTGDVLDLLDSLGC